MEIKLEKTNDYNLLYKQLEAILKDEDYLISKMANMSSFLYHSIPDIIWIGFYLIHNDVLKLGPFQGKIACSNISFGKGVCGTCWKEEKTIVVDDVHKFDGHIVCDSHSNSEVVIPIFSNGKMIAQLDVDSNIFAKFDKELVSFLEKCTNLL